MTNPLSSSHNQHQRVRVGLVQWEMRPTPDWAAFFQSTAHQVRALANQGARFVLFPEYFAVPLVALAPADADEKEQLHWLAQQAGVIKDHFRDLAQQYETYIVAGSTLAFDQGELRNVCYFCHPNGHVDEYHKLHLTPWEAGYWGVQPGQTPGLFDTEFGKIAICICYDVEFPELARLYALEGAQILFVPFSTDSEQGYYRVRHCAQARAIENECYVALAGCVGNLPQITHIEYQFGQSAVLTPSDYGFPPRGNQLEAPINLSAGLIAELDLSALEHVRLHGSVRNLRDRRPELYQLSWQKP